MAGPSRLLIALAVAAALPSSVHAAASPPLWVPASVAPGPRAQLETLAQDALVSTRVEGPRHAMRPDVFEYLLDHPDFASHVTRALGLARYRIWRASDGLWLDDGWGTRGTFTLIYAAPGLRLYHARGAFDPRFLPEVRGQAVAVLEYDFTSDGAGRTLVASRATGYLQVDNKVLRTLGKVAAPFVQAKADKEAGQLLRVFARTSRAIEENPGEVYQKVSERADVPRQELERFRQLLRLP
jgi:hypothetical protein